MDREDHIINIDLVSESVLTAEEKNVFNTLYTEVRNPVAHGLTYRLYEPMLGRKSAHIYEVDTNYGVVYEKASVLRIEHIFDLISTKN
ncbi:hypothetical protein BGP75_16565 [Motiliproteus sp. MSK22-1]|nr:hypothetical protein BGP75_16565 [Motiliproteus sp. MSK22-1]